MAADCFSVCGKHAPRCVGDCALGGVSRSIEGNKEDKDCLSPDLKRFQKCSSHRPVAGLLPAVLFHIRETVHRAVATAAAVLFNSIQTESSLFSLPSV